MHKHKDQRVGVFVDVQNMYYSSKNLYGKFVNFRAILEQAVYDRKLIRSTAYVIESGIPDQNSFFKALEEQGFNINSKPLQIFAGGNKKGDWDVGITVDAIKMSLQLDVVILVTGDGDFVPLVDYLQYHGVLVEVIAFEETTSARLIEKADDFFNISSDTKKFLISGTKITRRKK
ncbi:MAG: NYN domain-containing protein [Patescibacteria group bacterium]|nr:NYN domain-containing protein [Patescibacteria group bacterium]MDD4304001.1 NYN domain-containing protein [Patescibacteria group bacterium]MDD4695010.1 NYN domain-containing protein [Patescibacteria group bacterium]